MRKHLSDLVSSRDNNFNLLRFSAATGVFISHVFILSGIGMKPGTAVLGYISVNVFFIISGFLVTKSLIDRSDIYKFTQARVLRIFPALILAVLFSTFVVGLGFTTLPKAQFLVDPATQEYMLKNILLLIPEIPEKLPGVFVETPVSRIVNAPLWTLPYEIKMYILLGVVGLLLIYKPSVNKKRIFLLSFFIITLISMMMFVVGYSSRSEPIDFGFKYDYFRFVAMFGSGVVLFMIRDKLYLSTKYSLVILALIIASSLYRPLFVAMTFISLSYLVLYLAYIPGGFLRKFNSLGDYSYGIYIYGYPVQQAIEHIWPNLNLAGYFMATYSTTMFLAVLSWHFVEKRALRLKSRIMEN